MAKKMLDMISKDKRLFRSAILFMLVFAIIVGFISIEYYKSINKIRFAESSSYLKEVSKQMGANTQKILDDTYAILGTISSVLKNTQALSVEEFKDIVGQQKDLWHFSDVMLADENGILYSADGKVITLPNNTALSKTIVDRVSTMASAQVINGKECIVFSIPVDDIVIKNKSFTALSVSYALDTFDGIITTSAFDGKAYTHIIDKSGTVVVRSTSTFAESCGYNLLTYLDGAVTKNTAALDTMKEDIKASKSGISIVSVDGTEKYISYYSLSTSDWCLITFVPSAVANEKSNILMQISAVFCIFITVTMVLLVLLLVVSFIRHNHKLEAIAFIDPITKGNTLQRFQLISEVILLENQAKRYAMVYINVERFKILNDQFGRNTGDLILKAVNEGISDDLQASGEAVARVMADHFCVLMEYQTETQTIARFKKWREAIEQAIETQGLDIVLSPMSFGVYVINVPTMPVPFMVDRAKLSLSEKTNTYLSKIHYSLYDESKRDQLFREKQLEDRMEQALQNGEFEVYLQPKYRADTKKIGGAEALIRWNDSDGKMIYPDEFIPLFEKNGFVIQIDLWVFEQVCATLQRWQDTGRELVTISINCSKLNLNRSDFIDRYIEIFRKYSIPPKFLEIELTESVVYEDTQRLLDIIADLHRIGFTCSIDDFGSGYSSLNMIQNIPVDVLKLDKIFFKNTRDNGDRAQSVIGGIISMAKALNMTTVAEGVELEEQVEMLARLNCDFIQGYVFARPMPIQAFEQLDF